MESQKENENTLNNNNYNTIANVEKENKQPRYISLYEKSIQKKEKLRKLEKDINLERGITFTPTKYSSNSYRNSSNSKTDMVDDYTSKPKLTNLKAQ